MHFNFLQRVPSFDASSCVYLGDVPLSYHWSAVTKCKVHMSDLGRLQIGITDQEKYLRFACMKINTSLQKLEVIYVLTKDIL